jgi:hypothetical protein
MTSAWGRNYRVLAESILAGPEGKGYGCGMGIAEIMREVRKLPDDELLALAAQVDEEAARAVDHRFESLVREGRFEDAAADALREEKQGKTVSLHEVIDQHGVS